MMAVTSEASAIVSFPLRTFIAGPGRSREMSAREQQQQQQASKKSAAVRLTESRARFVRRGSREELDDNVGEEENREGPRQGRQLHEALSSDDTQDDVYRAVPYGRRGPQTVSWPPPPASGNPPETGPSRLRKGSRDRTLEIVEASLAHSTNQAASSDDDAVFHPPQGTVGNNSPNSTSPQSAREGSSAGSRVRKLREQFLNLGSSESKSDAGQVQRSGSSSSSSREVRKGRLHDHQRDAAQDQTRADAANGNRSQLQSSQALPAKTASPEKNQDKVVSVTKSLGTPREDRSQETEPGSNSEGAPASVPSSDVLAEQTRRQMERFKARYATAATAKESCQERKISKIVLKPQSQVGERKDQSNSVNELCSMSSSNIVRQRSHTAEEVQTGQSLDPGKDQVLKPEAHVGRERDRQPTDNSKQDSTYRKTYLADHIELPTMMTSEEIRRLRRAKDHNVSGKSPERWGDAAETAKPPTAALEHAVYHAGDRVVGQVSGTVFPTKHQASGKVFHAVLQTEEAVRQYSPVEVIHRRAKSDLDRSSAATRSTKAEANSLRVRHRSQDDHLHQDPLLQDPLLQEPAQKGTVSNVYLPRAKPSPGPITEFQEKSWAPISFNQNQKRNDSSRMMQGQGSHFQGNEAPSSDICKAQTDEADLQTPRSHVPHDTPRKIFAPETTHAQAKSTVQSILSGIMGSPDGGGEPVSLRPPQKEYNGTRIPSGLSAPEIPTKLIHRGANINETSLSHGNNDELNSNIYFPADNENRPAGDSLRFGASKDVQLTAVGDDNRDTGGKIKAVSVEIQAGGGRGGRYAKHQDKDRTHRLKHSEPTTVESDKRRKLSQKSDTSSSRQKGVRPGGREGPTPNTGEERRGKKISLAELLSKDAQEVKPEPSDYARHPKGAGVRAFGRDETDSKWSAPLRPDRSHGNHSETDSDAELQQSKCLRIKRPQRRAENKQEDKSLQNLLSRIINPEDDLNTLKRGQKLQAPKNPEPQSTRKTCRTTFSSSTGESENEVAVDKVITKQRKPPPKKKLEGTAEPRVRRPLLNLNLKQTSDSRRAPNREHPVPPPESPTSPTRRGCQRQRSKSDLGMSPLRSVSSDHSDVERFFNQMGLNESFFQKPLSPTFSFGDEDEVFHEMHEYKYARHEDDDDNGTFSTEHSDNISQGSKISEEGLHLAKKLPDTSKSIITKNARVIKWLCQMKKARSSSIS